MEITLRSDFHNTTTVVRVPSLPATLTASQERRVKRALCGSEGCQCGGIRGPQCGPNGERLTVERDWDAPATGEYPPIKISTR